MFYINVVGQTMYATSAHDHLVDGSQEFVKFRFQLSEEWNGLTVFAQFRQGNDAYNKYLDGENTVKLPTEIKEGTCTLMLYGSHDTVIGTSNYLIFRVDKNMLVSNAGSTQISQSLYEQLVTNVAGMKTRLDQIEKDGVSTERLSELIGEEIKKYMASGQPTGSAEGAVLYNQSQALTADQRKTARENLGIYTGGATPSNPQEGDIWVDPASGAVGATTASAITYCNYGVVLPELVYDSNTYRHMYIANDGVTYRAYCCANPWTVSNGVITCTAKRYTLTGKTWVPDETSIYTTNTATATLIWTNTKIADADGTVHLEECGDPSRIRPARSIYVIDAVTATTITDFSFLDDGDVALMSIDSVDQVGDMT